MPINWFLIVVAALTIGSAIIAGFFLTFSDFLMRSLHLSKNSAGIEVMQVINIEVWKSIIMGMMWSLLALGLAAWIYSSFFHPGPETVFVDLGTGSYFLGVLVISYVFNIPMNNQLDEVEFDEPKAAEYWQGQYVPKWTFWNGWRAAACTGASLCFLLAGFSTT
jgi:uncharacterized membrane protein